MAGDDRGDRRVAAGAGGRGRAVASPGGSGLARAGQAQQLVEGHVQVDLGGLASPVGQPAGDEAAARFGEGVVLPLARRPGVFRAGLDGQGVQHRAQRRGAVGGQLAVEGAGAAEVGEQPDPPVAEPVTVTVAVGAGEPLVQLLGQRGQVGQAGAAGRGVEEDLVRARAELGGQAAGPPGELPGPGHRQLARGERGRDQRVGGQVPHPPGAGGRRGAGDPGLPPQPRHRAGGSVVLEPPARGERGQHD